ncbi:MAG TPA: CocE/NonD family hydrolase, partial [Caldilineaceae bacterium]|nr:CocE/NonD family hydrolase [Caldilineaceae bacterium]
DEAYSLVYTSEPLAEDLSIIGWPHALLQVVSTATVMGFAVSLSDVAPDGTSQLVCKGMLNGTRRQSLTDPQPLTPGEIYQLDIQLDCTAWRFAKGQRIRLTIASADWPNVWPTPERGVNQIFYGATQPSCLILPVAPAQGSATPPNFLPTRMAVQRFGEAVHPPTWEVTLDVLSGRVRSTIAVAREQRVDERTILRRENSVISTVDPTDPASASARGRALHEIIRANFTVRGSSEMIVQATATDFHVTIDLNLSLNEAPHFHKRWQISTPRVLL